MGTGTLQIWIDARNTLSHGHIVGPVSFSSHNQEGWNAVSWSHCTLAGIKIRGFFGILG